MPGVLSGQAVAGVEVGFDPATVALVLAAVAVGGLVKGLVGFGYAVATLAGMALLDRVPGRPLALGLGLFTLAYVLLKQDRTAVPGERPLRERRLVDGCPAELGVGVVAGLVFGASNVGVQVVAYLDSLDLDRATFVGVLSTVPVGLSVVRIGVAGAPGLYEGGGLLLVSVVAAVPGLAGVGLGKRLGATAGGDRRDGRLAAARRHRAPPAGEGLRRLMSSITGIPARRVCRREK